MFLDERSGRGPACAPYVFVARLWSLDCFKAHNLNALDAIIKGERASPAGRGRAAGCAAAIGQGLLRGTGRLDNYTGLGRYGSTHYICHGVEPRTGRILQI
ncbi:hypothetical protein EVAR_52163_1 [Eumeta japonica]|uniref:Uncharacterized protein n=1 Tax=Eumeta variegata TaxID=151549 RepID=A0A4C1Y9L0_EUMVA|nr:hypothetical protein EVAR_52163_1 [Eumeta japonica]